MRVRNGFRLLTRFACFTFLLWLPAQLCGQSFNLQTDRQPVTSLDGLWRFHTGDDPQWASPSFDDSQWPLLRSNESWNLQGYKGYSGYAWYRFTIQVPNGGEALSVMLAPIRAGYQVYANGKLIGGYGYMPPQRLSVLSRPEVYDLSPATNTGPHTVQIAVRVWQFPEWAAYAPGGVLAPGNVAGDSLLIHRQMQASDAAHLSRSINTYAYCILALLFGLLVLGLFLLRPSEREYLWFALLLLASAADAALNIAFSLATVPVQVFDVVEGCLLGIFQIAGLLFFSNVLHVRRNFWWRFACVTAFLTPVTPFLYILDWTSVPVSGTAAVLCTLPSQLWVLAVLVRRAARKDVNARLLLIPVLLVYGFTAVDNLIGIAFQFGWQSWALSLNLSFVHFSFQLGLKDLLFTIFAFTMMVFLIRRFSLGRREEERLSGELEAARSMQSLLVPASAPHTPGFAVESVYLPASEVGGDFFQVQPGDDGSLLIVVGDVSGKGLKAAMTVSTIVGALRNEKERGPAEVLANLNRVLHGQIGGFVTCCAAFISADGAMTIANAGHLSPYLNGEELAVAAGLPLGMLAEGTYELTVYPLSAGDRLSFMSDGVVEARNTNGELYGFERTQQISQQTAASIAEIARHFGQEDDITVLRIQFVGAEAVVSEMT